MSISYRAAYMAWLEQCLMVSLVAPT